MKITYRFITGETTEVEVSEDIGTVVVDSRRIEHNGDERERYHREFSFDGVEYEGTIFADKDTPESLIAQTEDNSRLYNSLSCLTDAQRRRLLLYADGLTIREIASAEGVQLKAVQDSIAQARKKLQKILG